MAEATIPRTPTVRGFQGRSWSRPTAKAACKHEDEHETSETCDQGKAQKQRDFSGGLDGLKRTPIDDSEPCTGCIASMMGTSISGCMYEAPGSKHAQG